MAGQQTRAALPIRDEAKAKIIVARAERTTCSDDGLELLYPDIETHHAVINRMKGARSYRAGLDSDTAA